jgi:hypothetical protein
MAKMVEHESLLPTQFSISPHGAAAVPWLEKPYTQALDESRAGEELIERLQSSAASIYIQWGN